MAFAPWRTNPAFIGAILVAVDLPPNLMGNYHLASNASPAFNAGAASKSGVAAPTTDIDDGARPASAGSTLAPTSSGRPEPEAAAVAAAAVARASPRWRILDNFNRANATTLGANWSQVVLFGAASIRVNSNQARTSCVPGQAFWNGAGNALGEQPGSGLHVRERAGLEHARSS